MIHVGKPLLGRFTRTVPVTLFRIQVGAAAKLRPEASATAAGRKSFDICCAPDSNAVAPRDPAEPRFLGPNGMSLRPAGHMCGVIVGMFRGRGARVFEVRQGVSIPEELVLLHEHTDHYSLQPAVPMTLDELNAGLTRFLAQPGVIVHKSKDAFWAAFPEMCPAAVGCDDASP